MEAASGPLVGVLALQGGVAEHVDMLTRLGARTRLVRRPGETEGLDALVLPGGESTTLLHLLRILGLTEEVTAAARRLPVLGTCAGLILLSRLGVLDVDVERNAFGRQVDSVSAVLPWGDETVAASFIRAPAVTRCGPGVEVLSSWEGRVVGVRSGRVTGVSFHPELTGDTRLHEELLAQVGGVREAVAC